MKQKPPYQRVRINPWMDFVFDGTDLYLDIGRYYPQMFYLRIPINDLWYYLCRYIEEKYIPFFCPQSRKETKAFGVFLLV